MDTIEEVKINDFIVKPVIKKGKGKKKFPAYRLFNREYFICGLLAPTMTGKTTVLKNILDEMMPTKKNRKYKLWIFGRTLHHDHTWKTILDMIAKRGFEITYYTDLEDLKKVVTKINNPEENDYPFKKHIIVIDDMGDEMRNRTLNILTKTGRHKCCVFLSCQSSTDIEPSARKNIHLWLLFNRLNDKVLEELYNCARPSQTFEEFKTIYNTAINGEKHNFLYYDRLNDEYRRNFNTKLVIE